MTALKALKWSLQLDYEFIFHVPDIPVFQKAVFILRKYGVFLKNVLFGLNGVNSATVFGHEYFYNEVYGLASLQRVYCASHRLKKLLPERPVIVDIGANIGQFSFFCRHYLQAQRVVSIEPVKDCHELLRANTFSPTDCLNCLVSNSGVTEFYRCTTSTQMSSTIRDERESYAPGELLSSRRLTDLVRENGVEKIDLLKVDTEGSEYDVLCSGEEILDRVGMVLVEMSVFRPSAGNIFATGSFLNGRNFELLSMECRHGSRPKDVDAVFIRR